MENTCCALRVSRFDGDSDAAVPHFPDAPGFDSQTPGTQAMRLFCW